jgi:SanA protein
MNPRRSFKRIIVSSFVVGWLVFLGLIFACNIWIIASTRARVFYDVESIPFNNDGLVLGTGKLIEKSGINRHFVQRVDAAAALYRAGKVKRLILSGDKGYDEPMEMKRALLQRGVPESALVLDNYGLRTLDSVVRARDIFKCSKLTIISERFHDFRALFLAHYFGVDAVAYAPEDLSVRWMIHSTAREYLARVKAVLDLYVLNTQPAVSVR